MVTLPDKVTVGELAQTLWSEPALIVGAGVNPTIILSETASHVPFPVEVNVNVMLPPEISPGEGVYIAFNVFALGEKLPEPEDIQIPPLAMVTLPLKVIFELLAQTD